MTCHAGAQLFNVIERYRNNDEFTDLVLQCEAQDIRVHRLVVCPQSKVLYSACTGGFKEASTGVIEMEGDRLLIVKKMLDFLYTADYDEDITASLEQDFAQSTSQIISPLQLHAAVFALADKYDVPNLSALAHTKYCSRLRDSCNVIEFLQSVGEVYEATPPSIRLLRDEAAKYALITLGNALKSPNVQAAYETVVEEVPDFTRDVLKLYIQASLQADCANCGPYQAMHASQAKCTRFRRGRELGYRLLD